MTKPKSRAQIFLYDTRDPDLAPIWKEFAEAFARSTGGLAIEAGASASESLNRIIKAYAEAATEGRYECIGSIELFGHGSPGSALDNKFTAADFETQQVLDAASTRGPEASGASTVLENVRLGDQITQLRGMLCGTSFVHFRSCNTFKGEAGARFAKAASRSLGTYAVGHTEYIDAQLPGRLVYGPTGDVVPNVPAAALPPARPAEQLPVRYFRVTVDLSQLEPDRILAKLLPGDVAKTLAELPEFLSKSLSSLLSEVAFKVLEIDVEVLQGDVENFKLRAQFAHPELVSIVELLEFLKSELSVATHSPMFANMQSEGDAAVVSIDREIVERLVNLPSGVSFRIEAKHDEISYGSIPITITPAQTGSSALARAGGVTLGASVGHIITPSPDPVVRASVDLPWLNWRNLVRASVSLGVLGGRKTLAGEARANLALGSPEAFTFDTSLIGGAGYIQGRHGAYFGAGIGATFYPGKQLGLDLGFEYDLLASMTPDPSFMQMLMLRAGWTFP